MSNKILFVDTETGGLDPNKNSLLSVGFVIWENGIIIDKKEIFIKSENYNVNPFALEFNKLNLLEVYNKGKNEDEFKVEFNEFILKNFKFGELIILAGHNVNFDVSFLKVFFSKVGIKLSDYFTHRYIDTSSICKFMYHSNLVEKDISSSDKAFLYFGIEVANRHSALGDAIATAELYSKLIEKINGHANIT